MSLSAGHARSRTGLAAFLVLGGALFAPGCRKLTTTERPDSTARVLANSVSPPATVATLVSEPKHDFGEATQGDTLRHVFVTHNSTFATLTVEDTAPVLGCAGEPVPSVLEPGQDGTLEVTCRATLYGPLRVSLPLRANGSPAGELALTAEVEPLLAFDRTMLDASIPFGTERLTEARLRGKLARSARLTLATEPPPGMEATVLPGVDAGAEGVALRVRRALVGTHVGSLRFFTGLTQPKEVALSYLVKVTGTLTVSPTNPVLDLAAPGGMRAIVTVTSTQPGFRVEHADVLEGPFVTRVRRGRAGFEIEVSVTRALLAPAASGVNGRIRIVSNDHSEPKKDLPLLAFGPRPGVAR